MKYVTVFLCLFPCIAGKYAMSTRNTPRVDISQIDARNVTCDDRLLDEFIQQLMKLAHVCFFIWFAISMFNIVLLCRQLDA